MDRRKFFGLLGAGVAGVALEQAIPFGRVWSFSSKIVLPEEMVIFDLQPVGKGIPLFRVGDRITIAPPKRFIIREVTVTIPENYTVTEVRPGVIGVKPIRQKNVLDL